MDWIGLVWFGFCVVTILVSVLCHACGRVAEKDIPGKTTS